MSISTAHTLQCSLHLWTWTLWGMVCKSVSPNSSSHWCFFVWKNLLVHVPLKILIKTKNVPSIENKAFERTLDFRILKMFKFQNAVIQCLTQWHVLQRSLCIGERSGFPIHLQLKTVWLHNPSGLNAGALLSHIKSLQFFPPQALYSCMQGKTTSDSWDTYRLHCQCLCGNEKGGQDQQRHNFHLSKNTSGRSASCNCLG